LVILDGELVRYFWAIYQDEQTDVRTKFLAATKLTEIAKECRRSLELTELETRLDRIEALITSLRTRADGIDSIQAKQLDLIQALYDHISPEEDEDTG
jgi:predicted helicase